MILKTLNLIINKIKHVIVQEFNFNYFNISFSCASNDDFNRIIFRKSSTNFLINFINSIEYLLG
jgi:hypothetical protein